MARSGTTRPPLRYGGGLAQGRRRVPVTKPSDARSIAHRQIDGQPTERRRSIPSGLPYPLLFSPPFFLCPQGVHHLMGFFRSLPPPSIHSIPYHHHHHPLPASPPLVGPPCFPRPPHSLPTRWADLAPLSGPGTGGRCPTSISGLRSTTRGLVPRHAVYLPDRSTTRTQRPPSRQAFRNGVRTRVAQNPSCPRHRSSPAGAVARSLGAIICRRHVGGAPEQCSAAAAIAPEVGY